MGKPKGSTNKPKPQKDINISISTNTLIMKSLFIFLIFILSLQKIGMAMVFDDLQSAQEWIRHDKYQDCPNEDDMVTPWANQGGELTCYHDGKCNIYGIVERKGKVIVYKDRVSIEKEYIYKKHVPERNYIIKKDGSMLMYDYCSGCDDRPATDEEIEAFWKKTHPEWYK